MQEGNSMISFSAYYNGNSYITEEKIDIPKNQKVIITLLDESIPLRSKKSMAEIKSYMIGGKSIPNGISTVDYVKSLRAE